MSGRYPYSEDQSLNHQGSIVWSESHDQSMLDDSNTASNNLADSINDGYVTAVEDNETQYFSILETSNDITLDDLHNLTVTNSKIHQENLVFTEEIIEANNEENVNTVDLGGQQVVVFTVDGSEDLYGIQFAQDEDGNIQKYQFKFRTSEDGQLEAVPDSIELLPNDDEIQFESNQEVHINQESDIVGVLHEPQTDEDASDCLEQDAENECAEDQEEHELQEIFIKGEQHSPGPYEDSNKDEQEEYVKDADIEDSNHNVEYEGDEENITDGHNEYEEEETVDVKAHILDESLQYRNSTPGFNNIKQELLQEESQNGERHQFNETNEVFEKHATIANNHPAYQRNVPTEQSDQDDNIDNTIVDNYNNYLEDDTDLEPEEEIVLPHSNTIEHYEEIYVQESHICTEENNYEEEVVQDHDEFHQENKKKHYDISADESVNDNDSDNEEYQIVEGVHITGDVDDNATEHENILRELLEKPTATEKANILKHSITKSTKDMRNKRNTSVLYYVIQHPEKENVNSLSDNNGASLIPKSVRANPRSVLKSSFPFSKEVIKPTTINDERLHKRFARSKEAVQAKLFHNFISKTTIPHAPVRQTRLPRKQEIKPVDERRNEEIIVQEVMVSSKGFIENVADRLKDKDKLEVTAVVELTDSDEEYDPKKSNKKKKKQRKHRKDEQDETDSDNSVIEIFQSDEEETNKDTESPKRGRGRPKKFVTAFCRTSNEKSEEVNLLKRRRGRPPKPTQGTLEESPSKRSRTESDDTETEKKEINCPHCTKTFASQNSLNTHIQHHNLENCLKNSQHRLEKLAVVKQSAIPKMEYRHKCDKCEMAFKNSILLKRHTCLKKPAGYKCNICLKGFQDVAMLNIHVRTHAKQNLVKNTSLVKISPKKSISCFSTNKLNSPKKISVASNNYKCKDCAKVCLSLANLNAHMKTHKKFICPTCPSTFSSRLLLDTHVRTNCVKSRSPVNKRLSFKIKRSFIHTPPRLSIKATSSTAPNNSDLNKTLSVFKLECETCGMKFSTHRNLFLHKVQKHGLDTPDKSILSKPRKSLYKPKGAHGGIPANERMKKAYAALRKRLESEEIQEG